MYTHLLLAALLLPAAAATPAWNDSLGSRLDRQYLGYVAQPLTATEALAAGWAPILGASCDDQVGTAWGFNTERPGELDEAHPVLLYYSAAGQISAIGVFIRHPPFIPKWYRVMEERGYISSLWAASRDSGFRVALRDMTTAGEPLSLCSSATIFPELLGTNVTLKGPTDDMDVKVRLLSRAYGLLFPFLSLLPYLLA